MSVDIIRLALLKVHSYIIMFNVQWPVYQLGRKIEANRWNFSPNPLSIKFILFINIIMSYDSPSPRTLRVYGKSAQLHLKFEQNLGGSINGARKFHFYSKRQNICKNRCQNLYPIKP